MKVGEKNTLSINSNSSNLLWTSSDDTIVLIDNDTGEITALRSGTVVITVSLIDNPSIFDTCTIDVIDSKIASLSNTTINIIPGESYGLSVIFNSFYSGDKSVVWSSDNPNIVSVDSNGFITGEKIGNAKIYATLSNGEHLICSVNVVEETVPIEKITFNQNEMHLDLNSELLLNYTISPKNASNQGLIFESNNSDIVSVDDNGYIKVLNYGKTEIKVKVNDDIFSICTIYVDKKDDQITINLVTTNYTGSNVSATATSNSGLDVSLSYYSDSSCKNNATPINAGTYYAIGNTSGNDDYNAATSSCTKAIVINKKDDQITINSIETNYTGSNVSATATSNSGLDVSLSYYSDSSCKNNATPVNAGTYYAIGNTSGNDNYKAATSQCIKAVTITESNPTSILIDKRAISVKAGNTYQLNAIITPNDATDKNVIWESSNTNIATVNSNGLVTGVSIGNVTINARTVNGLTTSVSVAVLESDLVDSYESSTLSYYIENPTDTYLVTHIWVEDAYNQFKAAMTPEQTEGVLIPRTAIGGSQILRYEVDTKGYQNKGLIGINGSPGKTSKFLTQAPSHWYGTAALPIVISDGEIIRDSANEEQLINNNYKIYGITKNGVLKSYAYPISNGYISNPDSLRNSLNNDGIKYTFGFRPVIRENGVNKISNTTSNNNKDIRQVICQVDKNNFIIITNTINMKERDRGLSFIELQTITENMNCLTTFNTDGGGSTTYLYKKNYDELIKIGTGESITPGKGGERDLVQMLYFVEK